MDKKLSKIEKLLSPLNDFVTNDEFLRLLKIVEGIKERTNETLERISKIHVDLIEKNKNDYETNLGYLKEELKNDFNTELAKLKTLQKELDTMITERLAKIKDGKNADEIKIVQDVLSQIKMPEYKETVLDDAYEIRNKLETLNDDERLRIEAIDNLREELDELKKKETVVKGGGGGFSKMAMDIHIIDDETPSETPNGVITDFTLSHIPSPATSLKVYKDGQRMKLTTDYTLSGTTVSFVSAPLTGSLITFDFRI